MSRKAAITALLILASIIGSVFVYKKFIKSPPKKLYATECAEKRNISQVVSASGRLEIRDLMKIGSHQSGIVAEICVKENDIVKKGQLLAEIDPGTGETDFQKAFLENDKAKKELDYQKNVYDRQKQLYDSGQLSKSSFEKLHNDFIKAELNFKIAKTNLEQQRIKLNNRQIVAAGSGLITNIAITKGEGVTGGDYSSKALFEIAPDVTKMEVKFDVDESDIGYVRGGENVELNLNTYPDRTIYTKIECVDFSPKDSKKGSDNAMFYKATTTIDNAEKLFRPGMVANAKIIVAKAKDVLCVKGMVFQINPKILETAAKTIKFGFKKLAKEDKKKVKKSHLKDRVKFVWVEQEKSFVEKAVVLGITDDNYFEIKSGIDEKDKILVDVQEVDEMEKLYKKWFSGAL
jgi:HlyD family secretion protein